VRDEKINTFGRRERKTVFHFPDEIWTNYQILKSLPRMTKNAELACKVFFPSINGAIEERCF